MASNWDALDWGGGEGELPRRSNSGAYLGGPALSGDLLNFDLDVSTPGEFEGLIDGDLPIQGVVRGVLESTPLRCCAGEENGV